jgi:hypothetical protein
MTLFAVFLSLSTNPLDGSLNSTGSKFFVISSVFSISTGSGFGCGGDYRRPRYYYCCCC